MKTLKLAVLSFVLSLSGVGIMSLATASASLPADGGASNSASPTAATPSGGTAASDACAGLTQIDPSHDCTSGDSSITNVIRAAVNILSYIIGAAAIVMVIVAGLKYSVSSGDSARISSAKNTLVYALIGLAIAALAQVLVHFVLTQSTKAANGKVSISRQVDPA